MKTSDIPRYKNVLFALTSELKIDDSKAALAYDNLSDELKERKTAFLAAKFVGCCGTTSSTGERVVLPILLDDEQLQIQNPLDYNKVVLGVMIYLENKNFYIAINNIARNLFLNETTRSFTTGLIAHEIGHHLAGHRGKPKQDNPYTMDNLDTAVSTLLEGKSVFPDIEYEADLYGVCLVGYGPMLALWTMLANVASNIGIRMEFSNKITRFVEHSLNPNFKLPDIGYSDFKVSIMSDEELEEFEKNIDLDKSDESSDDEVTLETFLTALRYAYYVKADPLVGDYIYDAVDRLTKRILPETSKINGIGSDMESSYTEEEISLYYKMKTG